jgi:hypothetical protein
MRWGRGQCGRVLNCEEITVYKFDHSTVDERPAVRFTLLKTLVGERGFEPPTPWSRIQRPR